MNLKIEVIPKKIGSNSLGLGSLELSVKNKLNLNSIHTFSHIKELKNKLELEMLNYGLAMTHDKIIIRN